MQQKIASIFISFFLLALLLPNIAAAAQWGIETTTRFIPPLPFPPFGGKVIQKNLKFCIFKVPCPPCIAFIPFQYIKIGKPMPTVLYRLFGISRIYREYRLDVTAQTVGNFGYNWDDIFRKEVCKINGAALPNADGVIWKVGTSCKEGEGTSCRRIKDNPYSQWAEYTSEKGKFDPSEFPDICDPSGPLGTCNPPPSEEIP